LLSKCKNKINKFLYLLFYQNKKKSKKYNLLRDLCKNYLIGLKDFKKKKKITARECSHLKNCPKNVQKKKMIDLLFSIVF